MTDRLYYADSYLTSFAAHVVDRTTVEGQPAVILDRSAFYPAGGGQPADRGWLNGAAVVEVMSSAKAAGAVLHVLSRPLEEEAVMGSIDWTRRFDLMQQHTGQHILSQAFLRVLHADTIGFHLNEEPVHGTVTIDLNRVDVPPSDADAAEDLANQIVAENRTVTARFVTQAELAAMPPSGDLIPPSGDPMPPSGDPMPLRKPPTVDGDIRVVEIADFDRSACGGTHVARTGEVGQIKIIKLDRRGRDTRVEFRCGRRALIDYRLKNDLIGRVAAGLSIGYQELDQAVARLSRDNQLLFKQLEQAEAQLLEYEARDLLASARELGGWVAVTRAWADRDRDSLRKLAQHIVARPGTVALLGAGGRQPALVFARSGDLPFDMDALVRQAAARLNGKGGGSPEFAQAGGPPTGEEQVRQALEQALDELRRA